MGKGVGYIGSEIAISRINEGSLAFVDEMPDFQKDGSREFWNRACARLGIGNRLQSY